MLSLQRPRESSTSRKTPKAEIQIELRELTASVRGLEAKAVKIVGPARAVVAITLGVVAILALVLLWS